DVERIGAGHLGPRGRAGGADPVRRGRDAEPAGDELPPHARRRVARGIEPVVVGLVAAARQLGGGVLRDRGRRGEERRQERGHGGRRGERAGSSHHFGFFGSAAAGLAALSSTSCAMVRSPPSKGSTISPANARLMQPSTSWPDHGEPTTTSVARPFVPSKTTCTSPLPSGASFTTVGHSAALALPRRSATWICAFWSSSRPSIPGGAGVVGVSEERPLIGASAP